MIFMDFIDDAPDGLYDLEIALLDGYFRRENVATVPIELQRAVEYQSFESVCVCVCACLCVMCLLLGVVVAASASVGVLDHVTDMKKSCHKLISRT